MFWLLNITLCTLEKLYKQFKHGDTMPKAANHVNQVQTPDYSPSKTAFSFSDNSVLVKGF